MPVDGSKYAETALSLAFTLVNISDAFLIVLRSSGGFCRSRSKVNMMLNDDQDQIRYHAAMKLHARLISVEQFIRFEGDVAEIFPAFGKGPIPFHALCEHHALPFFGMAYVGYIAHENIIGISKLTRMVRLFYRRFSVQEQIGQQIADTLDTILPAICS